MKRFLAFLSPVLCLGFAILWLVYDKEKNYYLAAAVVLLFSAVPFFMSFEKSKPSASELSLTACLIALAVVSRAAFYLIPQVKPIGAVVVVSGVCLGAKRGYFVGAMSAFISNFIFGQGVWTPFQMAALGTVGLISGLVFGKIQAKRIPLAITGFLLCFAVYGFVVDSCSVLMMSAQPTLSSAITIYAAGAPFSLVFGLATAVFLLLFGEAFVKKINRIIVKYAILPEKNI